MHDISNIERASLFGEVFDVKTICIPESHKLSSNKLYDCCRSKVLYQKQKSIKIELKLVLVIFQSTAVWGSILC